MVVGVRKGVGEVKGQLGQAPKVPDDVSYKTNIPGVFWQLGVSAEISGEVVTWGH